MRLRRQTILLIVLVTARTTEGRVNSTAKQYPACYTDSSQWTTDLYDECMHPLYSICFSSTWYHLCCGPDHYCCNGNTACCRRNPWTVYEIVGMATGILSWACLLVVLRFCVGPRGVQKVHKFFKRNRKTSPLHDEAEMKAYDTSPNWDTWRFH